MLSFEVAFVPLMTVHGGPPNGRGTGAQVPGAKIVTETCTRGVND
jgi:hypothetical protein